MSNAVTEFREWAQHMSQQAAARKEAADRKQAEEYAKTHRWVNGCGRPLAMYSQVVALWTRPSVAHTYFGLRLQCDGCRNDMYKAGGGGDFECAILLEPMKCGEWIDLERKSQGYWRGHEPPLGDDEFGHIPR